MQIAFEYNGRQHYEFIKYWYKDVKELHHQQAIDKEKINLCVAHGVKLYVIPYNIPYDLLYEYIVKQLIKLPEGTPKTIDYDTLHINTKSDEVNIKITNYLANHYPGASFLKSQYN
ncbi:MAG: hypothetical protein EOO02_23790, partial [Chitinophagaceae bacterium]